MASGWNLWVWLAGGSVASGWNLWVWLECIGVVSGWCCKEVIDFLIIITYPYSTCINSFLAAASLLLRLNVFLFL